MITDQDTNFLYFSDKLNEERYSDFYGKFIEALEDHNIDYKTIEQTKDIWCRDYMPIQVAENKFVQFRYDPDYLNDDEEIKTDGNVITQLLGIDTIPSNVNLDGGNVVKSQDKIILTDKIFRENREEYSSDELIKELQKRFNTENIIIIPSMVDDDIGHSDGMVRFCDDTTALINDYSMTEHSKSWQTKFKKSLAKYRMDLIEIPYIEVLQKNDEGIYPATGCYINYLHIGDIIFLPQFGIPEDTQAKKQFKDLFRGKTIVPIDCNPIADRGGVLNCISWNIKKKK